MKARAAIGVFVCAMLIVFYVTHLPSQPSFNGNTPGCGPSNGCHTFQDGILTVTPLGNLQVRVTITGNSGNVAGELVDSTGAVVALNNGTSSNPFVLTAPSEGRYTVNAGFKDPSPRKWDSTQVILLLTGVRSSDPPTVAENYRLDQNYPNPFNPVTTIGYVLPIQRHVTITVFDATGSEVARLVDGIQSPGEQSVQWDAGGMPSGVYFYRLDTGDFSAVRKLLLLR